MVLVIKKAFSILAINIASLCLLLAVKFGMLVLIPMGIVGLISTAFFVYYNISPIKKDYPTKRIYILASGSALLRFFLISLTFTVIVQALVVAYLWVTIEPLTKMMIALMACGIIYAVIGEAIVFWNGMLRVYFTSVQLGIRHRVLGALLGWILGVNIYYLNKIIKVCNNEVEFETEKIELNNVRVESEICKTKYPILMVHGVFFRDLRHLNYWGRIPKELQKNGAIIHYGKQQSAGTVENNGRELAERIEAIVKETGCEKVNIIAHSKGGLDCRYALSHFGADKYVASLTTINSPHNGCVFAEYLIEHIPEQIIQTATKGYNATLQKFGEHPDFIGAITDLTATKCRERNENTKDVEGVLYESVMSYCNKPQNGQFPLNFSNILVNHFDGKNDGLVAIESAKWGTSFTLIEPKGNRGISHGDVIDLNRENIDGFDVREFFVKLVESLKNRGY